MSKTVPLLAVALGAALLAFAPAAEAARKADAPKDNGTMFLFISPAGEPFYAPPSEPYPIVKWFKQADTNGDGKLDIDEFRADAARFFKTLDLDGDGVISSQEVTYYERIVVPVILNPSALDTGIIRVSLQAGAGSIDPGGGSPGDTGDFVLPQRLIGDQGAVPYSLLREPEPVRSADRNFDYVITQREFLDLSDRHFHALDKTDQGFLLLTDLKKTEFEIRNHAHR